MSFGYITEKINNISEKEFHLPTTVDGYTPKNKKCFCYPYCYIELNNYSGSKVELKYENFRQIDHDVPLPENGIFKLLIRTATSMSPTIGCMPEYYESNDNVIFSTNGHDGGEINPRYLISYTEFSLLPYTYDDFANWYALNSYSIGWKAFETALGGAMSLATGNPMGVVSGLSDLIGQQMQILDKKKTPDSLVGKVNGDFGKFTNYSSLYYNEIQAKAEYIEIVDNYFTRFGYQVNTTQSATITNRVNFDYIQTVECNIQGDIPQEDIDELEAIFNNGVTIWHNINTYGDYNVDNRPRGQQ